jgi:predicted acetyltransferase
LNIELVRIEETEKPVLRQLIELYNYDFSEYDQADVNAHGWYGYRYLDHYWTEETRHPFFIKVDGRLAGLVLINEYCYILKDAGARSIAEFFVMRKYRKQGVGRAVARDLFSRFPGKWEVVQCGANLPSIRFWEKVVGECTGNRFERHPVSTEDWDGQALVFDTSE